MPPAPTPSPMHRHVPTNRFEPINTAVFIFANLQNIYDSWLNPNVNGYQEGVPFFSERVLGMTPALYGASASLFERNLGGIPTIYTQFADGFSALQAASNRQFACTGLLQCFNALSARAEPTNVILVGHALGGAYATVGGPWAAIAFPQSTIQVATAGAPAVVANNLFYVVRQWQHGIASSVLLLVCWLVVACPVATSMFAFTCPACPDVQQPGGHALQRCQWPGPCAALPRLHIQHAAGLAGRHVHQQYAYGNAGAQLRSC